MPRPPALVAAGTRLTLDEFQAEFRAAWAALRSRFLKVEAWQSYQELAATGSQQAFQRGDLARARELLQQEAEQDRPLYEDIKRRGLEYARIRLVKQPWSDYLRYELMAYEIRARMGENIVVVPTDPDVSLPNAEFFDLLLFDRDTALVHDYGTTDVGHQTGGWLIRDPQAIEDLERRALALRAQAVPLDRYLSRTDAQGEPD